MATTGGVTMKEAGAVEIPPGALRATLSRVRTYFKEKEPVKLEGGAKIFATYLAKTLNGDKSEWRRKLAAQLESNDRFLQYFTDGLKGIMGERKANELIAILKKGEEVSAEQAVAVINSLFSNPHRLREIYFTDMWRDIVREEDRLRKAGYRGEKVSPIQVAMEKRSSLKADLEVLLMTPLDDNNLDTSLENVLAANRWRAESGDDLAKEIVAKAAELQEERRKVGPRLEIIGTEFREKMGVFADSYQVIDKFCRGEGKDSVRTLLALRESGILPSLVLEAYAESGRVALEAVAAAIEKDYGAEAAAKFKSEAEHRVMELANAGEPRPLAKMVEEFRSRMTRLDSLEKVVANAAEIRKQKEAITEIKRKLVLARTEETRERLEMERSNAQAAIEKIKESREITDLKLADAIDANLTEVEQLVNELEESSDRAAEQLVSRLRDRISPKGRAALQIADVFDSDGTSANIAIHKEFEEAMREAARAETSGKGRWRSVGEKLSKATETGVKTAAERRLTWGGILDAGTAEVKIPPVLKKTGVFAGKAAVAPYYATLWALGKYPVPQMIALEEAARMPYPRTLGRFGARPLAWGLTIAGVLGLDAVSARWLGSGFFLTTVPVETREEGRVVDRRMGFAFPESITEAPAAFEYRWIRDWFRKSWDFSTEGAKALDYSKLTAEQKLLWAVGFDLKEMDGLMLNRLGKRYAETRSTVGKVLGEGILKIMQESPGTYMFDSTRKKEMIGYLASLKKAPKNLFEELRTNEFIYQTYAYYASHSIDENGQIRKADVGENSKFLMIYVNPDRYNEFVITMLEEARRYDKLAREAATDEEKQKYATYANYFRSIDNIRQEVSKPDMGPPLKEFIIRTTSDSDLEKIKKGEKTTESLFNMIAISRAIEAKAVEPVSEAPTIRAKVTAGTWMSHPWLVSQRGDDKAAAMGMGLRLTDAEANKLFDAINAVPEYQKLSEVKKDNGAKLTGVQALYRTATGQIEGAVPVPIESKKPPGAKKRRAEEEFGR